MTAVFLQIHQMDSHKEEALLLLQHFPVVRTVLINLWRLKLGPVFSDIAYFLLAVD